MQRVDQLASHRARSLLSSPRSPTPQTAPVQASDALSIGRCTGCEQPGSPRVVPPRRLLLFGLPSAQLAASGRSTQAPLAPRCAQSPDAAELRPPLERLLSSSAQVRMACLCCSIPLLFSASCFVAPVLCIGRFTSTNFTARAWLPTPPEPRQASRRLLSVALDRRPPPARPAFASQRPTPTTPPPRLRRPTACCPARRIERRTRLRRRRKLSSRNRSSRCVSRPIPVILDPAESSSCTARPRRATRPAREAARRTLALADPSSPSSTARQPLQQQQQPQDPSRRRQHESKDESPLSTARYRPSNSSRAWFSRLSRGWVVLVFGSGVAPGHRAARRRRRYDRQEGAARAGAGPAGRRRRRAAALDDSQPRERERRELDSAAQDGQEAHRRRGHRARRRCGDRRGRRRRRQQKPGGAGRGACGHGDECGSRSHDAAVHVEYAIGSRRGMDPGRLALRRRARDSGSERRERDDLVQHRR